MMKTTSGEEVETGDLPGPLLGANDECRQPHPVPSQPAPFPGISILDKLIRTCPVWLQLNTRKERVAEVLHMEPRGAFMVRKDCILTNMILSVNFPGAEGKPNVLEYSIKEENSIMYLDGSLLVFEDIFKMVAFYCVSRDILPSPLILPQVIAEATNPEELEVVSHLGIDFWNSYMNRGNREGSSKVSKDLNIINRQTQNLVTPPHLSTDKSACSCAIELSAGSDRLWFVNPVFIKEYCSTAHSPGPPLEPTPNPASNRDLKVRRPPPLPPRPKLSEVIAVMSDNDRRRNQLLKGEATKKNTEVCTRQEQESLVEPIKELERKEIEISTVNIAVQNTDHLPPVPPRRRPVESQPTDTTCDKSEEMAQSNGNTQNDEPSDQTYVKSTQNEQNLLSEKTTNVDKGLASNTPAGPDAEQESQSCQQTPIAPPRRKKMARREAEQEGTATDQESKTPTASELNTTKGLSEDASDSSAQSLTSADSQSGQPRNFTELKIADESLYSPECNVVSPTDEIDSSSNSSTEEELDSVNTPSKLKKQRQSMMLNKARNRLSIMTLTNVLNAFRSTDRKIMKKIMELAQEKASYFGQLIQDYRAYTLEMMGNQTSSTEMLQEIRQMMTQLKSYLLQSTELTLMTDSSIQSEDKLEAIVEAALCKCVLKPLKDNINNQLKEIHSKNGNLKLLKENQQIVQNTTTTELGVTTSVPEVSVLEKIHQKLSHMHQTYSPDKKVTYLLKSCKMIYDSMSVGNHAKSHGADDFLPVLMYVLARSNLTSLLLDVEYMMELLDPSLHLGEGYYYLTTTYGALEHIKHFDKQTVTRQLSHEVQDSIHQWERRRTLNLKQVPRSSVQDFLSVCFLDYGCNIKTFAINPETTAEKLSKQCAGKFGVSESEDYCIHLVVEEKSMQLADNAVPHHLKSILRKMQPQKDHYFIYKQANQAEETENPPIRDLPPF
ncbi:ras and Rab interactor 3 isoform X2 [Hypanus sabinus]|uniref:ras and Rab interactor 3 isoform X2 n=1 Tax=Hypanus sabinus TaxID=79690 RepID=UPI0028C4EECF|nr:ras and Rab interactor 3 isoform X2 [Hypanus sabinus]